MYKCSIAKPIGLCAKCEHAKPHKPNPTCDGTCFGEGHQTSEGANINKIVVACVEIPESITTEEL